MSSRGGSGPDGGAASDEGDGVVVVQGYELDEISTHPLMGTWLRAISELRRRGLEGFVTSAAVTSAADPGAPLGMPTWMHALLREMRKGEADLDAARSELDDALALCGLKSERTSAAKARCAALDETFQKTLNVSAC